MENYEEEMNRNDKLTGCIQRLRKRGQVREKYELRVLNMWLEVFTE
jgi:hypothetical protein